MLRTYSKVGTLPESTNGTNFWKEFCPSIGSLDDGGKDKDKDECLRLIYLYKVYI